MLTVLNGSRKRVLHTSTSEPLEYVTTLYPVSVFGKLAKRSDPKQLEALFEAFLQS